MRALRTSLPDARRVAADAAIARGVLGLSAYRAADVVLSYLSMRDEVETREIIRDAWVRKKVVALPYCVPHTCDLRWFRVERLDGLVRNRFGVEEPDPVTAVEVDWRQAAVPVALVPALSIDDEGYRLGYGAGFYDRFLADFTGVSIGLCRAAQRVKSLCDLGAVGVFDRPVDVVVSG